MKNNIFYRLLRAIALIMMCIIMLNGCNWLDVVPDNLPSLADAFKNRASAERSLFSCYSFLPDPTSPFGYPAYFTNRDEFEYGWIPANYYGYACFIARGEQNTGSPYLDYWSGKNGGKSMFQAIRTCNIFFEGIHQPRDITESERKKWIAEVKFLKAYYHFFLLQLYGPIPIINESLPVSATPDEVRVFREPVDECIDYITRLIDEAIPDLPLTIANPTDEDGRITQPIALAVKAKALVWGASPLFNGNPDYRDWRDSRDKQLVSDTYSREKWVKAAAAIREAIDVCHSAGHKLYRYDKALSAQTYRMSDSLVLTMNVRKAVTERWNPGVIWSSTYRFSNAKDGVADQAGNSAWQNMQEALLPMLHSSYYTGLFASFNMAELFYTKNGIPIDEDNEWDYDDRYQLRVSSNEAGNGLYIPIGQQTVALHFDREPRFYANLAFDRGYVELSVLTNNGGVSFSPYFTLRSGEVGSSFVPNIIGYCVKKLIAFETSCSAGSVNRGYSGYNYRFPLIRLADLYLLYSEALNEIKDAPDNEVYDWINQVREITGLKGVVEAWQKSKFPNRPKDKNEMRKIIQHERLIEFAFEGQRFWDIRRWKLLRNSRTYAPVGWNYRGKTADDYYTVTKVAAGLNFFVKDYLWPISNSDLDINVNLVQSYGW